MAAESKVTGLSLIEMLGCFLILFLGIPLFMIYSPKLLPYIIIVISICFILLGSYNLVLYKYQNKVY